MESTMTCNQPVQQIPSANIPQIFLDTATKDHICLLSDELLSGSGGTFHSGHNFSNSLPDLSGVTPDATDGNGANTNSSPNQRRRRGQRRNDGNGGNGKSGSLLSVYCSPRMSRKRISKEISKAGDGKHTNANKEPDISWIKSVGYKRNLFFDRSRLESNSSAESSADSSVRNASHVSTCATSEYTRFTSCDRLSTLAGDELGLNRLRRISSNPEAKVFNNTHSSDGGGMRDSKSCSDLKENGTLINHELVEQKLHQGDGLGLLSPPPLVHTTLLQKFEKAENDEEVVECMDIVSEHVPREQIKSNRETRVREWLQELGNTNEQI